MILCFRRLKNPINLFNLWFFIIVGTRRALSARGSRLVISVFSVFGQRTRCPYNYLTDSPSPIPYPRAEGDAPPAPLNT